MLTSLLEHNPYQGILTPTIYKEKLKELDTILSVYTQEKIEEEEKSICPIRIRWFYRSGPHDGLQEGQATLYLL